MINEQLDTVKEKVLKYLNEEERCRNDDKYLIWRVMNEYTKMYIPFEDFSKIPSFESIRRQRQHIQNTLKILLPTSEEVRKRRGILKEEWRRYFRPKPIKTMKKTQHLNTKYDTQVI